ncbi:hypothetical protein [Nannocystis pusilla]|uniref:PIN domain-containing protein n=1 Tax=Nannocystis pusilla TaxID=889268 RepID=A0ABS7TIR7_9BACT|nr:hypothetical protein [Nannocystis pusilla]MBZ5708109.1 hypothetical protein [Nannocystis pusilla]
MAEWVIDTNVLIIATTAQQGRPPRRIANDENPVPVTTEKELWEVFSWLEAVNKDPSTYVVLDVLHHFIEKEYSNKIEKDEYGRMVIANKLTKCHYRPVYVEPDENGDPWIPHDAGHKVFDHADRRMVAAAVESGAPIANACDTDWLDLLHDGTLAELGISVHQIIEVWCREEWARVKARKAGK